VTGANPSVKVGELNQQSNKKLSKTAFKRVLKAKTTWRYSAKLSPDVRKEREDKFNEKGLFDLRKQTAQVNHLPIDLSSDDGTDREPVLLASR